jgi:hypothetical protein
MRHTLETLLVVASLSCLIFGLAPSLAGDDEDERPVLLETQERPEPVVSTSVPFVAGTSIPELPHPIIKLESLTIAIGEVKKGHQKVSVKIVARNFGTQDYYVIITGTLQDEEGKPIAVKTDKEDIDRNEREDLTLKLKLDEKEVARAKTLRLEMSYLED